MTIKINSYNWLKKDEHLKKFMSAVSSGVYSVDFEALQREIESLHIGRKLRVLTHKEVISQTQKQLITASLQEQAARSRLVGIKITCKELRDRLNLRYGAVESYLYSTYAEELNKVAKTIANKQNVIYMVMSKANDISTRLSQLEETADMVISDIDQGSFTLQRILNTLDITAKQERTI